jgi:hypothetical protein
MSDWTGWQAFGNNFAGSYTYRQIYWDDVATMSGYMARNQAVLRNGVAKTDLAVIANGSGNLFQDLLDNGYSYHLASEALLHLDSATVSNHRLNEQGPAYKAIIVTGTTRQAGGGPGGGPGGPGGPGAPQAEFQGPDNIAASFEPEPARTYSVASIRKLRELADAGLPVVLVNMDRIAIAGTESGENTNKNLLAELDNLRESTGVVEVAERDDVLGALRSLSVEPDAQYVQAALETTHFVDPLDGASYYYLYNNPNPDNAGMINAAAADRYKSAPAISAGVTLTGSGAPYRLDAWTGEVEPIVGYQVTDEGKVATSVELHGGESTIIALLPEGAVMDASAPISETGAGGSMAPLDLGGASWDLELRSYGPDKSDANIQGKIVPEFDTPYTIYKDPSASIVTTVQFDGISLGSWADLPATAEQLQTLGVNSMQNISGIGLYSTTFELPADWNNETGATLVLGYSQDQVTRVVVNGEVLDRINVIADEVEVGGLLQPGENTLTVKLVTGLFNRAVVESMVFDLPGPQINGNTPVEYGLKSVRIVP